MLLSLFSPVGTLAAGAKSGFVDALEPGMNTKLQMMSVNLPEYGAKMQTYFNYRTEHPANDELGDYADLVLHSVPTVTGSYTVSDHGYTAVSLYRHAPGVSSVMELQYAFNCDASPELSELHVEITVDGKTTILEGDQLIPGGKRFFVTFSGLLPTQADEDIRIIVRSKQTGEPVSETITDRLSYAAAGFQTMENTPICDAVNAVNAMLNYYRLAKLAYS